MTRVRGNFILEANVQLSWLTASVFAPGASCAPRATVRRSPR
eukprot:COSAG06_NODE_61890_length_266_cov_0.934132_1_plen_41_part_10